MFIYVFSFFPFRSLIHLEFENCEHLSWDIWTAWRHSSNLISVSEVIWTNQWKKDYVQWLSCTVDKLNSLNMYYTSQADFHLWQSWKEIWNSDFPLCTDVLKWKWSPELIFTFCFWLNIPVIFLFLWQLGRNMRGRGKRQHSKKTWETGFILSHVIYWIRIPSFLQHFEILGLKVALSWGFIIIIVVHI